MTSRRVLKVAQAIREVVGMAILRDLRDPRIQDVTVTYVEVSADLRQAKVHVSVMGDDKKQQLSLRGLQHSAGYLQQKISDRVEMRYTPRLKFVLDQGVKNSILVSRVLGEVLPPEEPADEPPADEPRADPADPRGESAGDPSDTARPPAADSPPDEAPDRPSAD